MRGNVRFLFLVRFFYVSYNEDKMCTIHGFSERRYAWKKQLWKREEGINANGQGPTLIRSGPSRNDIGSARRRNTRQRMTRKRRMHRSRQNGYKAPQHRAVCVSGILLTGADNAQTGRDICRLLRISRRALTKAIEQERRAGSPICADTQRNPGYYLAANREEMVRYCDSLQRRADEIHKTRLACLATVGNIPEGPNDSFYI